MDDIGSAFGAGKQFITVTTKGGNTLESGLESLGLNAVAQRAGVSKMLIYRYFGSLEDLIAQYIIQRDY